MLRISSTFGLAAYQVISMGTASSDELLARSYLVEFDGCQAWNDHDWTQRNASHWHRMIVYVLDQTSDDAGLNDLKSFEVLIPRLIIDLS